ncbi:MAG: hypothetical protein JW749_03415, partial [Sedimentisphaerales bacterium]|nr:hypothetical protein [Sedimentisphaerales bacterium]
SKDYGSSQLFTATPTTGYDVNTWYVDGSPIQSSGTTYTLSNITAAHTVSVTFNIQTFSTTGTAGSNGSISPSGTFSNDYGSSQLFTATPNTGYEINIWYVDGTPVQTGNTTYTLTNITAAHTVNVTFKIQTFSITSTAGSNGSINPSGTFSKDYGSNQLFTATPTDGNDVDTWYVDGSPVQTGGTTYTLSNITTNHTVNVTFKILTYSITATTVGNGSIDPTGTFSKDYGSDQLFTATPDACYEVDAWYVDGSPVQTGGTTYTLSNITAAHTVNVTFKILTYSITATTGGNGSIDPSGTFSKDCGSDQLFTATPDTCYEVDTWYVDGSPVQTGGTTYTLSNITATHTVDVTFKIQTFSITATTGGNGSIDPSGTFSKDCGSDQLFTATPDACYEVDTWYVDGSPVQTGGTTYTLSNITTAHTVNVTFKILTYSITATAGSNGSIDPSGTFSKDCGSDQLFTATPDACYEVDTWYVDGSPVQTGGTTYTLSNITAAHTVNVTFKIQTFSITGTPGSKGSIDPSGTFSKDCGSSQLFTATPDTGHDVDIWYVDSSPVQTGGTTYTLSNITAAHTVNVTFKIQSFSITGTAGTNGSISPSGTFSKYYGSSQLFTGTPATGYDVDTWYVDGSPVQTGGTTYTLSNITAAHTVNVTFKIQTFTVTASAGAHGSVSPTSAVVPYSGGKLFIATPDPGYQVERWQLDGVDDLIDEYQNYYLSNITANHTVSVIFRPLPPPSYIETVGLWKTGLTHPIETGDNRVLIFIAHAEKELVPELNLISVTYGGRPMTKIIERNAYFYTGSAYTAAFILKDADISAATTNTFVPTWNLSTQVLYSSIFFVNVYQSAPIGASDGAVRGSGWYTPIETSPLPTASGDMVVLSAISGNPGVYTLNNDFIEGINQHLSIAGLATCVTGLKQAIGEYETPSALWAGGINREAIIGFVLQSTSRTLTVTSSAGGTVLDPGIGIFPYDEYSYVDLYAEADENYHFVNWTGSAVSMGRLFDDPNLPWGYVYMDYDYTLTANFAIDTRIVTVSAGQNGSIDPNGDIIVDYGYDRTFNATADYGFTVEAWYLDDQIVQIGGDTYTLNNVTEDHTVHVTFGIARVISGMITVAGSALPDVNIISLGVVTDINGFYTAEVADGWSGEVTPVKDGYTFDPNGRSYTGVTADQTDQNYIALPADDFNDNLRGAMWQVAGNWADSLYMVEQNQRLDITADGLGADKTAWFYANGWRLDPNLDFACKVNFHYDLSSSQTGWIGIKVADGDNYVQVTAGSDSNGLRFYYEAKVDGIITAEEETRAINDGSLYISYDANAGIIYMSYQGYGSENAYTWLSIPNPLTCQWNSNVAVSVGCGGDNLNASQGQAYLDNFEMATAELINWPPATDLDGSSYIDINDFAEMAENWLGTGPGDLDNNGIVDFLDFAVFGPAW